MIEPPAQESVDLQQGRTKLNRRHLTAAALAATLLAALPAAAQETVKICLILPMTGPSASTGR